MSDNDNQADKKQVKFDKLFGEAMDNMYALGYKHAMADLKWRKKEFHIISGIGFFIAGYFAIQTTKFGAIFIIIGIVEFGFSVYENYKELKVIKASLKAYDQSHRPKISKE